MEKSESITELAKALILFHLKVDKVRKDAKNPFFKSSYATLESVLEAIEIPLNESGLTFAQFPSGNYGLTTILIHAESGEYISSEYFMEPAKKDPQGAGSVITYQRRYALTSILGLSQEDDDANAGTHGSNGQAKTVLPVLKPGMDKWESACEALVKGTVTLKQIEAKYYLSRENRELLLTASI